MNKDIPESELRELETHINELIGEVWQALARSQYFLSRQKMSHKDAMTSVNNKVIEVVTKVLEKDE